MAHLTLALVLLLPPAAQAQNLRASLSAPVLPTVRFSPGLGAAAVAPLASPLLAPRLSAPLLPAAAPALTLTAAALPAPVIPVLPAVPAAAPAPAKATLANVTEAAAPALQALPNASGPAAHGVGVSLEDALTGRRSAGAVFAAPAAAVNAALPTARSAPAVSGVSYARGVTKAQRAVLDESLKRRKAGWFRGLARMGVALEGPVAPALKVVKAETLSTKAAAVVTGTAFTVEWKQGATRLGTFRVVVPTKDPEPEFRRLADPAPEDRKVVFLRFQDVPEADILAFAAARDLRVVARGFRDQPWTFAVTGRAQAAVVARKLNGQGIVLAATAKTAVYAEADQLHVAFVPGTFGPALAAAFRRHELTVLERSQDGLWRLGAAKGRGAKALDALLHDGTVLYARALKTDIPETRQTVLELAPNAAGNDLPGLLRRHGLTVLSELGGRTYLVGGALDSAALAAALAADPGAKSAVAVGSLADSAVEAAANGTASYKGRPWSSTEYNLNWAMGYDSLRRRGATAAQLKRYEELTAAAPVRGGSFNPWSGD